MTDPTAVDPAPNQEQLTYPMYSTSHGCVFVAICLALPLVPGAIVTAVGITHPAALAHGAAICGFVALGVLVTLWLRNGARVTFGHESLTARDWDGSSVEIYLDEIVRMIEVQSGFPSFPDHVLTLEFIDGDMPRRIRIAGYGAMFRGYPTPGFRALRDAVVRRLRLDTRDRLPRGGCSWLWLRVPVTYSRVWDRIDGYEYPAHREHNGLPRRARSDRRTFKVLKALLLLGLFTCGLCALILWNPS
ncbi:MAG TPA: hypothetical protein DGT21_10415 [Armatimonadetes bacterium]|nr:hypothetical protein [Armatimonadota bacterium]